MKIVKPMVTKMEYGYTLDEIFRNIADAAKVCYQTEKTKLNDKEFVEMLIKKRHYRPLEFGTIYLTIPNPDYEEGFEYYMLDEILHNHWTKWTTFYDTEFFVTTNMRVVIELLIDRCIPMEDILDKDFWLWKYLITPSDHHHFRHTFKFICSRGCGDDFRTHVSLSSIMESTRYNNYSKDKFEHQLTFIEPFWEYSVEDVEDFSKIEHIYLKKIAMNYTPQMAKNFLPLGLKTELWMCGFDDAWLNFIEKRDSTAAYPECQTLAHTLKQIYKS